MKTLVSSGALFTSALTKSCVPLVRHSSFVIEAEIIADQQAAANENKL
ncbi:MAG: hypothetical protein LC642_05145 [Verrucomicrobiaceae bacterium]|nr:hypothetical protein [Verrucomicrobiaceae bacterium]